MNRANSLPQDIITCCSVRSLEIKCKLPTTFVVHATSTSKKEKCKLCLTIIESNVQNNLHMHMEYISVNPILQTLWFFL